MQSLTTKPHPPAMATRPTRKRSRSSVEIFNLSTAAYDTKRARIGIQNLTTEPTPESKILETSGHIAPPMSRSCSSKSLESDNPGGKDESASISEDSMDYKLTDKQPPIAFAPKHEESTSESLSSSDESSGNGTDLLGDEGYDSDSESGSITTSSSSSSSSSSGSSSSSSGDSEDNEEENEDGNYSSRSATIGFPSPEQIKTSFDFSSAFKDPPHPHPAATTTSAKAASIASAQTLTKRLHSLLPQLVAANAQLDEERASGTLAQRNIETLDERQERYIEMDLGLGVLEEKPVSGGGAMSGAGSDNDGDESEGASSCRSGRSGRAWTAKGRTKKHDVMAALLGRKQLKKSAIQIVDG